MVYMQSLTLVLGTPEFTLESIAYDRMNEHNKVRIYIDESNYRGIEPDIPIETYLTKVMKFNYDDHLNQFYYHYNPNARLYSYEVSIEPRFYSKNLNRFIHNIYLEDLDWDRTLEKIGQLQFSLIYRRSRNTWIARNKKKLVRDPPLVCGEANVHILKEVLTYSDLHVIHTIAFYNVEWL